MDDFQNHLGQCVIKSRERDKIAKYYNDHSISQWKEGPGFGPEGCLEHGPRCKVLLH